MKKITAFVLALVSLLPLARCNRASVRDEAPQTSPAAEIACQTISADWPFYEDIHDFVEHSTLIVAGTITDISFQLLDLRTARPVTEETEEQYRCLHTIYTIDVTERYKGDPTEPTQMRILGGRENDYLEEQAAALGDDIKNGIPLLENMPELKIGETYLFALYQYEDTVPTPVNLTQGILSLDHTGSQDQSSPISAEAICSYFNRPDR